MLHIRGSEYGKLGSGASGTPRPDRCIPLLSHSRSSGSDACPCFAQACPTHPPPTLAVHSRESAIRFPRLVSWRRTTYGTLASGVRGWPWSPVSQDVLTAAAATAGLSGGLNKTRQARGARQRRWRKECAERWWAGAARSRPILFQAAAAVTCAAAEVEHDSATWCGPSGLTQSPLVGGAAGRDAASEQTVGDAAISGRGSGREPDLQGRRGACNAGLEGMRGGCYCHNGKAAGGGAHPC